MTQGLSTRQVAKRAQIARAARTLFLAQGYAATSMDAVTAEAGVSKQTLYSYFGTKLDLLASVLHVELSRLELAPPASDPPTTVAELRRLLVDFCAMFTERLMVPDSVALLRLVLAEAFRVPELRESVRDALPAQVLARTEALLGHANAIGIIRTSNLRLSARMFVGPLMSFVILDGVIRGEDIEPPSRSDLEFIVDAFLATVEASG